MKCCVPMGAFLRVLAVVVFPANGSATARDAMVSLLHACPIAGGLVASGIAARGSSVTPAAPGAG